MPRIRVAAIIVRNNRVLLVKHSKEGRSYWMLPGGGVNRGETLKDALKRELNEECCIDIEVGLLVLSSDAIAPDGSRHIVNLFFQADHVDGTPRLGDDKRVTEVAWRDVADLPSIALYPDFGAALQKMIAEGFPNHADYLGNLWR